jgi:hypothetical protein
MSAKTSANRNLMTQLASRLQMVECPIRFRVCVITPETAAWILENLNHPNNRRAKPFRIQMMAGDMREGLWRLTHQGIAFSEDGWLVDGANRLRSVVESGAAVKMLVFFDVPNESMSAFDVGTPRNVSDAAKISGIERVTHAHAAAAKRMIAGVRAHVPLSNQQVMEFIEEHWEAVDFAVSSFGAHEKGVTNASVYGAVGRAWFSQDRDRLAQFCRQLKTGMIDNPATDQAAVVLRNWLKSSADNMRYGSAATIAIYRKCERALVAFLGREKITRLYEASEECFPLPAERADSAAAVNAQAAAGNGNGNGSLWVTP